MSWYKVKTFQMIDLDTGDDAGTSQARLTTSDHIWVLAEFDAISKWCFNWKIHNNLHTHVEYNVKITKKV